MVVVRPEKGYEANAVNHLVWLGRSISATGFRQPRDSLARFLRHFYGEIL